MLTLIGQGRLAETEAFEEDDLKPIRVMMIPVRNVEKAKFLRQSVPVRKKESASTSYGQFGHAWRYIL
jgi:hypothetical protein